MNENTNKYVNSRIVIGRKRPPDWLNMGPPRPFGFPFHGQGLSAHMPLKFFKL